MRIHGFRRASFGGRVEVGATVTWEEAPRSPVDLVFAAEGDAAEALEPDSNAYLLAVALPAIRHGERRIAIEGAVCPRLTEGLRAASALFESWYGEPRRLPAIEPAAGFRAPHPASPRAACFLSGGVDSLDVLLRNRERLPANHPGSIRDALHVSRFPYRRDPASAAFSNHRARAASAASTLASTLDVTLTRVESNLVDVEANLAFSGREYYSAAYASMAHLFSSSWTSVALASGHHLVEFGLPSGSHPLLDPLYGSGALELRHEGTDRTRLEKIAAIARRPDLLRQVLVCPEAPLPEGEINCGRCEKCLRTMAELLVAGALGEAASFPVGALTAPAIESLLLIGDIVFFWISLAEPLRTLGRHDLANAIERKVRQARETERWLADAGWKGRLRRFDRRFLGERLLRLRRFLTGARTATSP